MLMIVREYDKTISVSRIKRGIRDTKKIIITCKIFNPYNNITPTMKELDQVRIPIHIDLYFTSINMIKTLQNQYIKNHQLSSFSL